MVRQATEGKVLPDAVRRSVAGQVDVPESGRRMCSAIWKRTMVGRTRNSWCRNWALTPARWCRPRKRTGPTRRAAAFDLCGGGGGARTWQSQLWRAHGARDCACQGVSPACARTDSRFLSCQRICHPGGGGHLRRTPCQRAANLAGEPLRGAAVRLGWGEEAVGGMGRDQYGAMGAGAAPELVTQCI